MIRPLKPRVCCKLVLAWSLVAAGGAAGEESAASGTGSAEPAAPESSLVVTTTDDAGEGSLRQAILEANARPGPATITFDPQVFAEPQTIRLETELPELSGELVLDGYIPDRLWRSTGVTLGGGGERPLVRVAAGAKVTISSLTLAAGFARNGAAILNRGSLVLENSTLEGNRARRRGGALLNQSGTVFVINSTFVGNRAGRSGGGIANKKGSITVTNCTFSDNSARKGGALYSRGALLLRNTILANSPSGGDCISLGAFDPASTRNLIEENRGCGNPISAADPKLESLGYYNGPTKTLPVGGGSPTINLGDNAAALDAQGEPLVWDQRGNGDPRFVAGYTDLGAFEQQAFPDLTVDTIEDTGLRACTRAGREDCPLRGAIELANATPEADVISFDPRVFAEPQSIVLSRPLPEVTSDLTLSAEGTGGVTLQSGDDFVVLGSTPQATLTLIGVQIAAGRSAQPKF